QDSNSAGVLVFPASGTFPNFYIRSGVDNVSTSDRMFISGTSGDVGINTLAPSEKLEVNGKVKATAFVGDGSGLTNLPGGGGGVGGSGSLNFVPKFTGPTTLGNSRITDNGTTITLGDASSPNIIAGYSGNFVTVGVLGANIGGGGSSLFPNRVTDD